MKIGGRRIPRRDLCALIAARASDLTADEATKAWFTMAGYLGGLVERDVPKFKDLVDAIRCGTITARATIPARSLSNPPVR